MTNWHCSYCGGNTAHYSPARMRMVCDRCGQVVQDPEQDRRRMVYDMSFTRANEYLRAGDWENARRTAAPLVQERPSDKRLYALMLSAVTHNYTDYLLDSRAECDEAFRYWERLSHLRGITGEMQRYAAERVRQYEKRLKNAALFAFVILLIGAVVLMTATAVGDGLFLCVAVGLMIGAVWLLASRAKLMSTLRKMWDFRKRVPNGNPFAWK